MSPRKREAFAWAAAAFAVAMGPALAEPSGEDLAALEKHRCPKPVEFASVFSFGYGRDHMPKDDVQFEKLVRVVKRLGFNVIHTSYTEKRMEICKKHGVRMMLDFLDGAAHHVRKTPDTCRALAGKLRGEPGLWGYNIHNDMFGKQGAGRRRDINSVRRWDPTHPAYCGTYRTYGARHLVNADCMGTYDFHWSGGTGQNFTNLKRFWTWAKARNCMFARWVQARPSKNARESVRRSLYTVNTSIAFGLRGVLWFLALEFVDGKTLEEQAPAAEIRKVHGEIMPLRKEIMKIGTPVHVFSTPTAEKDAMDRELPGSLKGKTPGGLPPFPPDFWMQPVAGEFLMGVSRDDRGRHAVFVANHNAYAPQRVKLKIPGEVKASQFSRAKGAWLALQAVDGVVSFDLQSGGGELLRFEK